jgi:hypothetical protein
MLPELDKSNERVPDTATYGGIHQSDVKAYRMLPGLSHGRAISICYCKE